MRVLAAMSGGVDSSVAAALAVEAGHDVVGVTLKLWDNPTGEGCCSVAEIDDARRAAHQIGIDHLVFNLMDDFEAAVVSPYAEGHAAGRTPNPCIECNRHVKFGRLLRRARQLGFEAVATGHHAQVVAVPGGRWSLRRGADATKDQSYVLYVLAQDQLARTMFPVGSMTKADVRARAAELGLCTASKPDSQDVCFVSTAGGRAEFLAGRIPLHAGRVVDGDGRQVGHVGSVELVTVGQRKGLGLRGGGPRQYALSVDPATATVVVGGEADLLAESVALADMCWVDEQAEGAVEVQTSAHGHPVGARFDPSSATVSFERPQPRVAAGQSVVLYRGASVLGGGIAR